MMRPHHAVLAAMLVLSVAPPALAQNQAPRQLTAEDYARAERLLGYNTNPLVLNAGVRPTWLPDGRFWYRTTRAAGPEFVLVDPVKRTKAPERRYAPELVADPFHQVMNRIHVLPNILVGLALFAWGGFSLVLWGVFVRLVLTLHGTWFVNSPAHTWGYRTWETKEDSRNHWWVGLVAWGEGWHNTHHAFQRSARHGFGWELDFTWLAIRSLEALGLARDIHLLPKNAERFRIPREAPVPAPLAA